MIDLDNDAHLIVDRPKKAANGQSFGVNGHEGSVNDTASMTRVGSVRPPSVTAVFFAAIVLLVAAYSIVFQLTIESSWDQSIGTAVANVLPLAAIAAATYVMLKHVVLRRGVVVQGFWHLALAPTFALAWYSLALVSLALFGSILTGEVKIGTFSDVAFIWQMFQGLVVYALVAAICYALRGGRTTATVRIIPTAGNLQRYLTKQGDELVPVAVDDIVLIRGAQDYAEVVTVDGRMHLVRMSLSEFEERLPDDRFVRVHRSTIVNIAHLGRAEPIGSGRLALHLAGGQMVQASRSGAQALRSLVL